MAWDHCQVQPCSREENSWRVAAWAVMLGCSTYCCILQVAVGDVQLHTSARVLLSKLLRRVCCADPKAREWSAPAPSSRIESKLAQCTAASNKLAQQRLRGGIAFAAVAAEAAAESRDTRAVAAGGGGGAGTSTVVCARVLTRCGAQGRATAAPPRPTRVLRTAPRSR